MNVLKRILLIALFLLGILLLPVFPARFIDHDDPKNIRDGRVSASISDKDLKEILSLVRGNSFLSCYEAFLRNGVEKVIFIRDSKESALYRLSLLEPVHAQAPLIGKIEVSVGYICGVTCCYGIDFYLDIIGGEWVIVTSSPWIS